MKIYYYLSYFFTLRKVTACPAVYKRRSPPTIIYLPPLSLEEEFCKEHLFRFDKDDVEAVLARKPFVYAVTWLCFQLCLQPYLEAARVQMTEAEFPGVPD